MYVRPISIVSLLTELLLPVCVVRADDDTTLGMLADDVVQEVKHVGYVCVTRPNCVVTVINQSRAYPRTCFSRIIEQPRWRNPWKSAADFS